MFHFPQYLIQVLVNLNFRSGTFDHFVHIWIIIILRLFEMVPVCDGKQKTLLGELQNYGFLHLDIPILTVYTHTHI